MDKSCASAHFALYGLIRTTEHQKSPSSFASDTEHFLFIHITFVMNPVHIL